MNNQPPELSREARRLIAEARGADDPTSDDQARVKARWLASAAAVAGVSSLTEAARAAGGIGWGFKAAGAALVMAAGAIGLNFVLDAGGLDAGGLDGRGLDGRGLEGGGAPSQAAQRSGSTSSLPGSGSTHERFREASPGRDVLQKPNAQIERPVAAVTEAAAPSRHLPSQAVAKQTVAEQTVAEQGRVAGSRALVGLPSPTRPEAATAAPTAVRPRAARAVVARPSAPKAAEKAAVPAASPAGAETPAPMAGGPSGQLSEELAVLSDVRSSIQTGLPTRALELLSRYDARFGQPILGMEADALHVDALCKVGRRDAAREKARAFQNDWPGSPLQRRVSAACP